LEDQGLGKFHIGWCIKETLEENREIFLRREEREGEESHIPRDIDLRGKREATRRICTHP